MPEVLLKHNGLSKYCRGWTICLWMMFISFVCFGCGGQILLPEAPTVYINAEDDPFGDVITAYQSNQVEVLYATDRSAQTSENGTVKYGTGRSRSLAVGLCQVSIGKDIAWDQLVKLSIKKKRSMSLPLTVTEINELIRVPDTTPVFMEKDGQLVPDPAIEHIRQQNLEAFSNLLSERLSLSSRKDIYIYIHGFNNSFEFAACRIAGLWHYLGRTGVPVLYSWPAGHGGSGLLRSYTHDRESGEFSVLHLKRFLQAVALCPDVENVHIIAHSRGTHVLTSALRELHLQYSAAGKDTRTELKLGNVILAAADIDHEVSTQSVDAELLPIVPKRMTVYMFTEDKALKLSNWLLVSKSRVGDLRESDLTEAERYLLHQFPDVNLITIQAKSTTASGHDYFISNPAVLSDLILLLRYNRNPGAEFGRPLIHQESGLWILPDGYPSASD